jgi:predicted O-linked N-acetylglucosamine transferase (SPINDLY family)
MMTGAWSMHSSISFALQARARHAFERNLQRRSERESRMSANDTQLVEAFNRLRRGDVAGAEATVRAALERSPESAPALAVLARVLASRGAVVEAQHEVDRALALDPACFPALMEDAALARRAGDLERAEHRLVAALAIHPAALPVQLDLGRIRLDRGDLEGAQEPLQRALALDPRAPEAMLLRADLAARRREFERALADYRAVVQQRPQLRPAWVSYARAAADSGDLGAAAEAWGRALSLNERDPAALRGFAEVALRVGDTVAVKRAMQRLASLEPGSPDPDFNIALACWREDDFAATTAALDRVLAAHPEHLASHWVRGHVPPTIAYDTQEQIDAVVQRYEGTLARFEVLPHDSPELRKALESMVYACNNFYIHYLAEPLPPLQRRAGALMRRMARLLLPDPVLAAPEPAPDGKRRVMVISAFLREHSVSKLFEGLLTGLDRTRIDLTLVYVGQSRDVITARLAQHADRLLLGEFSAAAWRRLIIERKPELIVHLDVGMDTNTQWLAAQRLAPVQAVLWGHPITTGMDSIDYFLTADGMERDGGEADYSETVVRLPRTGAYFRKPDLEPDPNFKAPTSAGAISYIIPQTIWKLLPHHDPLLARIAAAVPKAEFTLLPHSEARWREALAARIARAFAAQGIDATGRLHMLAQLSRAEYFALARGADVNLDPIGWSGGVSSFEILWFDTPTVTLPRASMRSRHTYSMLKLMELQPLIARDADDYVRIAVALGESADFRAEMRALIAERKHRLYEDRGVVDAFQQFLLEAQPRSANPAASPQPALSDPAA